MINEETFSFEIKEDGEIIKHTVQDKKKEVPPTPETPQPEQPTKPQSEKPQPEQVIEKPVPTPEKPQQIEKQPEQPKKATETLPTTGGKQENPIYVWIGAMLVVLGSIVTFYAFRIRKKAK